MNSINDNKQIENNLATIRKQISDFEKKYGRSADTVHLLAASKGQSTEKILAAIHAGQHCFGENYLQEALLKIENLKDYPIEWHFIGKIKRNKTGKIAAHFAWVHSISSSKIADRLNAQRPHHLPPLNVCIEVNISHEANKEGIAAQEALKLAKYCLTLPRLQLRGLMAIPEFKQNFAIQRQNFHQLYALWQSLRNQGVMLDTLSMGMSDDFEAAIAEGATLVRIGTAIFGKRFSQKK